MAAGGVVTPSGDNQKAIANFQACLKLTPTPQIKQFAQQQLAELGVK